MKRANKFSFYRFICKWNQQSGFIKQYFFQNISGHSVQPFYRKRIISNLELYFFPFFSYINLVVTLILILMVTLVKWFFRRRHNLLLCSNFDFLRIINIIDITNNPITLELNPYLWIFGTVTAKFLKKS